MINEKLRNHASVSRWKKQKWMNYWRARVTVDSQYLSSSTDSIPVVESFLMHEEKFMSNRRGTWKALGARRDRHERLQSWVHRSHSGRMGWGMEFERVNSRLGVLEEKIRPEPETRWTELHEISCCQEFVEVFVDEILWRAIFGQFVKVAFVGGIPLSSCFVSRRAIALQPQRVPQECGASWFASLRVWWNLRTKIRSCSVPPKLNSRVVSNLRLHSYAPCFLPIMSCFIHSLLPYKQSFTGFLSRWI